MLRQDVELLNNAISDLGNSFAQTRKEESDEDYRQQLLDREIAREKALEQHYTAENQHYKNQEEKQDALLQNQQVQGAIKQAGDLYDKMYGQLQQGAITEDQFNQFAKNFVDNHYDATHSILQNTPFAPWEGNSGYRAKKGQPAMMLTPGRVGNRDVAIGPKGSVNYTDTFAPADKAELDDASQAARDVQNALNKIVPADGANYSDQQAAQIRRLNKQKLDAQARRLSVLQRYQQPQQPQTPGAAAPTSAPSAPAQPTSTPPAAPTSTGTSMDPNVLRQQAQQAITNGKDPAAVRARFKQMTGQDL